jgi:hypothetical protein
LAVIAVDAVVNALIVAAGDAPGTAPAKVQNVPSAVNADGRIVARAVHRVTVTARAMANVQVVMPRGTAIVMQVRAPRVASRAATRRLPNMQHHALNLSQRR